jgi:hypothetical protein
VLAPGCAPRTLLERAIRARGGSLETIVRDVEATVHAGFPGVWRWRTGFRAPDRYAWSVATNVGFDHYLLDGGTVRVFVGERLVAAEPAAGAALRTHARFTAVVHLDALRLPGVQVAPLPPDVLPAGTVAGLAVAFADTGDRYTVGLDERLLVVAVEGPVSLAPYGAGTLGARYEEFRPANGFLLPHRTTYVFRGAPLADERAIAVCPAVPMPDEVFRAAGRLPSCGADPLSGSVTGAPRARRSS